MNNIKSINSLNIFIISAPSGAGKTTLVKRLCDDWSFIKPSISYTTRKKRATEEDGVDYHFITEKEFNKKVEKKESLDEVDPKLLETYAKLGIPLKEQEWLAGVAVDAVFDSVSLGTTFKEKLKEDGVIFSSFSEAVKEHPKLIKKYLGSVVPYSDNFFATLNSAVFSDGSFVYVPPGVKCPMELSTYFRINAAGTGQFERTLLLSLIHI